ncbi:ATP-dependent helicase [Thalassotalea piscium]|nr:ATP-dependent helicase [Thalassotalea piscium]
MDLSYEQSRPVADLGNIHVVSIPGSGKTRVIIAKVKVMLANGLTGIYLVTFTNKSADEMKERLISECGKSALEDVTISTFHSLMINHFQKYLPSYKLLTPEDKTSILHDIFVKHVKGHEGFSQFEDYVSSSNKSGNELFEQMNEEYKKYLHGKKNNTLDNIVSIGVQLMEKGELPIFDCDYLMVDEFQDTDIDQIKLIIIQGKMGINITTVGDDDQSIYGWRNALGYKGFKLLEKNLNSRQYMLSTNYRSKSEILTPAFTMIANNKYRIEKSVKCQKGLGGRLVHYHFPTRVDEAEFIVQEIQKESNINTMILARTNANLSYVETELIAHNLSYEKAGGAKYFQNTPCHLFLSTLRSIDGNSEHGTQRMLDILFNGQDGDRVEVSAIHSKSKPPSSLTPRQQAAFNGISNAYTYLKAFQIDRALDELSESLSIELEFLGYKFWERIPDLAQCLQRLPGNLTQRLAVFNQQTKEVESNIKLMTMHSSKGLESDRVFITCFSNKIIPSTRVNKGVDPTEHVEEERRLAFVAITRGKKEVILTSCENSDARKGWFGPSQFIDELGEIETHDYSKDKRKN